MSRESMKAAMAAAKAALPEPVITPYTPITPAPMDRPLPDFEWPAAINIASLFEPPPVVEGLLHRGSKMVLGGGSKSYKTWCLCDLAISVAGGHPWLGLPCVPGIVVYLNFEIQPVFFHKRIAAVCHAKGLPMPQNLAVWNLRGHCYDLRSLLPVLTQRLDQLRTAGNAPALIVLDPVYKSLGGRDENSAGDIGQLLGEIESLAEQTGAAVAFGAHFSKGNQAAKEAIDRISGSGVFARDPDTILTLTRHAEEDSFVVDATLRNFPKIAPFVVSWQFPLMRVNNTLNPEDLKAPGNAPKPIDSEAVLELLDAEGMTASQWETAVMDSEICGRAKFFKVKKELLDEGRVRKDGKLFYPVEEAAEASLLEPYPAPFLPAKNG